MPATENPFANYGNMITDEDRFIKRQEYLQEIESRVLRSPGGNLAIIGQRRVGKSSLAYQAVMTRRNDLLKRRILPIYLTTSTYNSPRRFFCDLASICFREFEELGWAGRRIREAADEVRRRDVDRFSFNELKSFFDETQSAGIRIIFCLTNLIKQSVFSRRTVHFLTAYET